jgi:hypothetical protein
MGSMNYIRNMGSVEGGEESPQLLRGRALQNKGLLGCSSYFGRPALRCGEARRALVGRQSLTLFTRIFCSGVGRFRRISGFFGVRFRRGVLGLYESSDSSTNSIMTIVAIVPTRSGICADRSLLVSSVAATGRSGTTQLRSVQIRNSGAGFAQSVILFRTLNACRDTAARRPLPFAPIS